MRPPNETLLASFFVLLWGSGYPANKLGLEYVAPLTFVPLHLCAVGLLMHAVNFAGSHYA